MRFAAPAVLALFALSAVACGDDTGATGTTSGGGSGDGGSGGEASTTTSGPTTSSSTTTSSTTTASTTTSTGSGDGGGGSDPGQGGGGSDPGQGGGGSDPGQGGGGSDPGQGGGGSDPGAGGGGSDPGAGGGGSDPGGDGETCDVAIPLVPGITEGTWVGAEDNYSPGASGNDCTGYAALGPDVAYSVSLEAGDTLIVDLTSATADASVYLVTDCADAAGTCAVGEDTIGTGETLEYTATAAVDLFLIVDQYASAPENVEFEPFTLDVTIASAPDGWTCSALYYGDNDLEMLCDCGCGIQDPTCVSTTDVAECDADGCTGGDEVDPADTTTCVAPPLAAGDTCGNAIALTEGTVQGTWVGSSHHYNPEGADGNSCTNNWPAVGTDVVYSVSLTAGQTLTVTLAGTAADESIYFLTDCADPVGSCVAGNDNGDPETAEYTAMADVEVFVIADQFGDSNFEPFTLTVNIADPGDCAIDEFTCADGACIPADQTCDGFRDCADDSDEGPGNVACDCTVSCESDGAELCLPATWTCDGVADCDDGSDEMSCGDFLTTGPIDVAVPDNNLTGICVDLVSDLAGTIAAVESVQVAATHTWVGDLRYSLVSPDGTTVIMMDNSDSSNLSSAAPITFDPDATVGASSIGANLSTDQVICQANGICSFFPQPGSFDAFANVAASGTWRFCARDDASGDTGRLAGVTLNVTRN